MVDTRLQGRQIFGIVGILAAIPAVAVYTIFFLSRFFSSELFSGGGMLIPDSGTMQKVLLLGLPLLGLLASMYAFGAARDSVSKTGLVLNTLVLLVTLSSLFLN
ncbi:hypothetical protein A3A39_00035 [Candidatus Kaiserbacteria bacterium RIFCSPLOWO2_01_FULL_54_13]|uniref:Uncharacterized protein n=1 Tax=Candidatus Kaiserbacteria bacterium RIFCSPLOWO2_01_FULL_54_13 TaxID=1798512 RepID=A0A1F6F0E7_9BACT|nr:MAG: hypothetical protein A3A39_00035 [Candidatus Kaiserbacteria bacterium RIFCSPLOWO2_01_FULL_54_13]